MTRPLLHLDVSRLARVMERGSPMRGIDRIERRVLLRASREDRFTLAPVRQHKGRLVRLRWQAVDALLSWCETEKRPGPLVRRLNAALPRPLVREGPSVTLNVSHAGLDDEGVFKAVPGAFAAYLHDIIPITHPELEAAGAPERHARRVANLSRNADLVVAISRATRDALAAWLDGQGLREPDVLVASNAACLDPPPEPAVFDRPTFAFVSTIDPRKNLGLLLSLWREFGDDPGSPQLVIVGRRGADATVCAMLSNGRWGERVREIGRVGDREAARIVAGVRALLAPSFVEGFGLPVAEAHLLGVPVIASDIAAHREVAGNGALYLSPLDGTGWREAILRLATDDALRDRLVEGRPRPQTWDAHFATVFPRLEEIAR